MLITPHFLTGLAIAKGSPEALPVGLAAVSSHFVLDAVPHKDTLGGYHLSTANIILVLVDAAIALLLWWWLIPITYRWYALAIGLLATLPDMLEIPGLLWPRVNQLPLIKQFHDWHTAILQYTREPKSWFIGLLPQALLTAVLLWYLAK